MRPMMRLVLGVFVLVGIMAGVAFGLPAHVTVTRSKSISAPESIVFPYLNNLHEFNEWSPWQLRDPELKVTYGGPQQGKGAQVKWTSEKPTVGSGSIEIVESDPNRNIDLAVDYNGLEGIGSYRIVPDGSGSKVTWNFIYESGSSPLKRWKALMLDGFVGAEYSAGLERLKEKIEAERRPTVPSFGLTPEGMPIQPGQPGGALPSGAVPQEGALTGAVPGAEAPGEDAEAEAAPAAAEAPAPAPAPKPKKKQQQRRQ
jgi:hypothetical protein